MDEIEQKKAELEALKNSNEGDKPEEPALIAGANAAAERLEKANAEEKANLKKREEIMAEDRLGGKTEVGGTPKQDERTQDQKDIDYSNSIMNGETTVKDVLDPEK